MAYKRSELVEDLKNIDLSFGSLGQNKTGISPGIANKKGTLLWDNSINLNYYSRFYFHNIFSLIPLKLSWFLFLAKIYNKEVEKN